MGHTPGPWTGRLIPAGQNTRGADVIIEDAEGRAIAHVIGVDNAPVLAAAPDMLAMLKAVNHALYVTGTGKAVKAAMAGSRDLIAKATNTKGG